MGTRRWNCPIPLAEVLQLGILQVVSDFEPLLQGHLGEPVAQSLRSQQLKVVPQPILVRLKQVLHAPFAARVV